MKCIFTTYKANTVTITYASILSLGTNQIKDSNLQNNKEINPNFEGIQNLVAWTAAPGVISATLTDFPCGL